MVDLLGVVKGATWWFLGVVATLITWHTVPPLLDILDTALSGIFPGSSTLLGIIWFGLFVVWIVGLIALPAWKVSDAITTQSSLGKAQLGIVGAVLFLFGIALTVAGWFWIPVIADLFSDTWLQGAFYASTVIVWGMIFYVAPINMILKARQ